MAGTNFFAPLSDNVQVALTDENGYAILAKCTDTLPSVGGVFQHGCILIKVDSGSGNKALYENVGTVESPSWNSIGAIAAGEITLANGKVLIGNSSNVATEQTISGDITISNTGVATIGEAKVNKTKLAYETVDLVFSGNDTVKQATITSGSIIIGWYLSSVSGTPTYQVPVLSISGTTLTGTLASAPGTNNNLTYTVILLKA